MLNRWIEHWRPRRPGRVAEIGWTLADDVASMIWDQPNVFRRDQTKPRSAKSVQVCPAAIDFDARHYVITCPIDLNLRFEYDEKGSPRLKNVSGLQSTVRGKSLQQMIKIVDRVEWRHIDRPILQFVTPYLFLADEPVYINQLPPYLDYANLPLPGVQICGRFPVHIWPRRLLWAFEWHDISQNLMLSRGQPWFYVRFECQDPSRPTRLIETDITPETQRYIDSISSVTNYVNRTYSLFERARRRRPKTLLSPRRNQASPLAE